MEKYHGNTVEYWKQNAEEDYIKTPISVLKYITILEEQSEQLRKHDVVWRSEQLSFTDGTMPPMGSKEFDCYHGLCECKQNCKT